MHHPLDNPNAGGTIGLICPESKMVENLVYTVTVSGAGSLTYTVGGNTYPVTIPSPVLFNVYKRSTLAIVVDIAHSPGID